MKIIAIAGGSGSGKSAVSYALVDSDPDTFEVLNFDDYQKVGDDSASLPQLHGMINWDHPDVIRWDKLIADIKKLQHGASITINTWAHRSNPDYAEHRRMISRTIHPRPVLIVEGYLALYNPDLNKLYDKSFYLDLDEAGRKARRGKNEIVAQANYETLVLQPMYAQYVLPTKQNADVVIDVADQSVEKICRKIKDEIS